MNLPFEWLRAFLMALPFPNRLGEWSKTRLGLNFAILATMVSVPSVLPSSDTIISCDLNKERAAASTSSTHSSI
jgi:hypothetical protein